jgi:hypothetical protein
VGYHRLSAIRARYEIRGSDFIVLCTAHIALGTALTSLRDGHGVFSLRRIFSEMKQRLQTRVDA